MCFCPSAYEIQSSGSKMKMAQNMSFMYLFENIYLLKQKYDYMASHYRCLLSGNFRMISEAVESSQTKMIEVYALAI